MANHESISSKNKGENPMKSIKEQLLHVKHKAPDVFAAVIAGREAYLEGLIAEPFLDEEGESMCPFDFNVYRFCEGCPIKDLCDEAEKIIEKESVVK